MKKCAWMVVCLMLATAPTAVAQYATGFEELIGAWDGYPLTGQDGYYIPTGTTSADFLVYSYPSNALNLPQNPTGADQFIGGTGPGGSVFARAQRDLSFEACTAWTMAFDFAATYLGSPPSANNIGSFSIRNDAAAINHYIHLMSWVDVANPTSFNAFFLGYDAGGTQHTQPGVSPGPEWENLALNHWYRAWATVDLTLNKFVEVGIIDLATGMQATYMPTDWYLTGGAAGATAPPDSFRFFGGGSVAGNTLAFDNLDIFPAGPSAVEPMTWGAIKTLYR